MSTRLPDDPWAGFLEALDSSLTEETTVHCLGGFAIQLHLGDLKSEGLPLPRPASVSEVVEVEAA